MKQPRKICKIAIIQTTVASKREAQKLSGLILKKRLAACVQTIPIRSLYRWKGKIESAGEFLLSIKTTVSSAARLVNFIKKNHSYELPEIVIISANASHEYAGWVDEAVKG
jgi:periplasmic divalent cation tolerance protein